MSVFDVKKYKLAKVFANDISKMLPIIDKMIKDISPYIRYSPATEILLVLRDNKSILEAHLNKCNKLIKEKGKME